MRALERCFLLSGTGFSETPLLQESVRSVPWDWLLSHFLTESKSLGWWEGINDQTWQPRMSLMVLSPWAPPSGQEQHFRGVSEDSAHCQGPGKGGRTEQKHRQHQEPKQSSGLLQAVLWETLRYQNSSGKKNPEALRVRLQQGIHGQQAERLHRPARKIERQMVFFSEWTYTFILKCDKMAKENKYL